MKKFEKELLFSQIEGETTTGSGNGSTGENAGEGENDQPEQEPVDEGAEADSNMYEGQDGSSSGQTSGEGGNTSTGQTEGEQSGNSQSEHPTENDSEFGWDLAIDDVIIIGTPPAENEEEPDEDEGDEYENNDVNEDDTQKSTEQSEEEKDSNFQFNLSNDDFDFSRPKPVPNGFCLIGCCQWALWKMFGKYPKFHVAKFIADKVTNNGFNGYGYSNKYEFKILDNICKTLNAIVQPIDLEDPIYGIKSFQSYLSADLGLVCMLSTGDDTEHAILITNVGNTGIYAAIDPTSEQPIFGSLTDSNIEQLYLIKR